jgi:hypothetical protein
MALDQVVPVVGPRTAAQFAADINEELAELYKRSFAKVASPAGTNSYTGSITPTRTLEDGNGFIMEVPNANTSSCTYNAKDLVSSEGAALQSGQLAAGQTIAFVYDSSSDHYRIVTPLSAGSSSIVRVYTSSTTWNKPSGLRYIKVRVQAPGGGGGSGTANSGAVGGGGGSGGFGEAVIVAASLAATEAVTIGAAGGSETAGGNASFGAHVLTTGGGAGSGGTAATGGVNGGDGGAVGSGGDINLAGIPGDPGIAGSASGSGAPSPIGGAGGRAVIADGGGRNAPNYGGGGSGAYRTSGTKNGGNGGAGVIIVEEFY